MKKLLLYFFMFGITLYLQAGSEQPPFEVKDPAVTNNFREIYLANDQINTLLTNNTSGQVLVGQGSGVNPIWQTTTTVTAGRILQIQSYTVNTASETTSTSFIDTTLSGSITPTLSTSQIFVFAEGNLYHSAAGFSATATLARGSTNLAPSTNGFCELRVSSSTAHITPCFMFTNDSPSTTSPTTYVVRMKTMSGIGTTGWGDGNVAGSKLILVEIGQ